MPILSFGHNPSILSFRQPRKLCSLTSDPTLFSSISSKSTWENGQLSLDVGNVKPDGLKVEISDGKITINVTEEIEYNGSYWLRSFSSTEVLPEYITKENLESEVKCTVKDGQLQVEFPKAIELNDSE